MNDGNSPLAVTELPLYEPKTGPSVALRLTGAETETVLSALSQYVEQRAEAASEPAVASRLRVVARKIRARADERSASLSTTT